MDAAQKVILLQYLNAFLADPQTTNEGETENCDSFDQKRIAALPTLEGLIRNFLSGKINLQKFKEEHEYKCREFPYWGFKGFSGQMQINQFVNNILPQLLESYWGSSGIVRRKCKDRTKIPILVCGACAVEAVFKL
jgi:hypothetical protein